MKILQMIIVIITMIMVIILNIILTTVTIMIMIIIIRVIVALHDLAQEETRSFLYGGLITSSPTIVKHNKH